MPSSTSLARPRLRPPPDDMVDLDLSSVKSERVIEVRRLHDRRHRESRGAFVVEGPPALEAAIGRGVAELYVTPQAQQRHGELIARAQETGARLWRVGEPVLEAMSETRQPQGIIAVCPLVTIPLDDALAVIGAGHRGFVVVLDRVNDPGNAGTVIRTADAMGAAAVILTEGSVDPHNGKCVRATAGSLFHVPISVDVAVAHVIDAVRTSGCVLVAADAHGTVALGTMGADAVLSGKVAWVIGNEAHGVHADLAAAAHETIAIPQFGGAESLNMAAAAAICLYATAQAQSRS